MQLRIHFDVRHHFEFSNQFDKSGAAVGPNIGHNTPTNVLAMEWRAGEGAT